MTNEPSPLGVEGAKNRGNMLQEVLGSLSNPINREILTLLKARRISAGELAEELKLSPAALSYHLKKLKTAGLIYETKEKNFIYYELDLTLLDEFILWLGKLKGENEHEKA